MSRPIETIKLTTNRPYHSWYIQISLGDSFMFYKGTMRQVFSMSEFLVWDVKIPHHVYDDKDTLFKFEDRVDDI